MGLKNGVKKEKPWFSWENQGFLVLQRGLEPRTPALKGRCSTYWATGAGISRLYSNRSPAKRGRFEEGKRKLRIWSFPLCGKRNEAVFFWRYWDGGTRTHYIGVKVRCVTITLHPKITANLLKQKAGKPTRWKGWDMGLEPTTPGTTIRCSTNWANPTI